MMFCGKECDSYRRYIDSLGKSFGRCLGTKEIEICNCGGDESKCDFHQEKRKKSRKPTLFDITQELIEGNFELRILRGTDFEERFRISIRDLNSGRIIENRIRRGSIIFSNFEEYLLEMIDSMIYELKE